jgi:hypothetical protein
MENDHPKLGYEPTVIHNLQLRWGGTGCKDMQRLPLNERKASGTVFFSIQQQDNLHSDGNR